MANLIESIDNLLVEYISNPVIYLRDYLKLSDADKGREVANRFPWLFKEWFERLTDSWAEPIQLEFDADDGNGLIRYLLSSGFDWTFETFYREEQDAFDWGVQGILSKFVSRMHTPRDPGERKQAGKNLVKAPTFLHMKFVRLVKNDWLIHFSDHANSIHESGFKYGVRDLTKLGITTRLDKHMLQGEGYNFAFLADEAEQGASAGFTSWKYGKEAVMFRASGVLTFHFGDKEHQVIFWGPTARDIVYLENDRGDWKVGSNKLGNPVYTNESLDDVVGWVKSNFSQYRKRMVRK